MTELLIVLILGAFGYTWWSNRQTKKTTDGMANAVNMNGRLINAARSTAENAMSEASNIRGDLSLVKDEVNQMKIVKKTPAKPRVSRAKPKAK